MHTNLIAGRRNQPFWFGVHDFRGLVRIKVKAIAYVLVLGEGIERHVKAMRAAEQLDRILGRRVEQQRNRPQPGSRVE